MNRRALLLFVTLAAIWGAPYAFIKVAGEELSPAMIAFLRTAIGAVTLLPVARSRGAFAGLGSRGGAIVALALLQMVAPFTLIAEGETRISSSLAGILVASVPLFLAVLSVPFAPGERPTGARLAGLLLGFAGVALLFGVDLGGGDPLRGGALVVLASVSYAGATLVLRRYLLDAQPLGLVTATMATAAALLALPAALTAPSEAPSADAVLSVLVLGMLCTGLAFLLLYRLIAMVGISTSSLVAYLAPVFAVAFGVLFLDEELTATVVAGMLLVVGGSWLAARAPSRPSEARTSPGGGRRRSRRRPPARAGSGS